MNESTAPAPDRKPPAFWPPLLLLGVLALLGVGAIVWLAYSTLEQVVSRETRQAELDGITLRLEQSQATLRDCGGKPWDSKADRRSHELQLAVSDLSQRKEVLDRDVSQAPGGRGEGRGGA